MKNLILFIVSLVVFVFPTFAQADSLEYKPVNPAFGGNPFNGPYLLNNATAQRQFTQSNERATPVEELTENVQRALVSRIGREIADSILGEDAKDSGSFQVGETQIDFQRLGGEVEIKINDFTTGGQTMIKVPVPRY